MPVVDPCSGEACPDCKAQLTYAGKGRWRCPTYDCDVIEQTGPRPPDALPGRGADDYGAQLHQAASEEQREADQRSSEAVPETPGIWDHLRAMQRHHALVAEEEAIKAGGAKVTENVHAARAARDRLFAKKLKELLDTYGPCSEPAQSEGRRIEERLVVTDLCDMHAFHREGRLGEVLRRAINFIEGRECFPGYPATKRCPCGECRESPLVPYRSDDERRAKEFLFDHFPSTPIRWTDVSDLMVLLGQVRSDATAPLSSSGGGQ